MGGNFVFLILGLGVVGLIVLIRPLGFEPAYRTVDHPNRWIRHLFRVCAFAVAYLGSFLVSSILVSKLFPHLDLQFRPEAIRLLALFAFPIPISLLFYISYLKLVRWSDKRQSLPR